MEGIETAEPEVHLTKSIRSHISDLIESDNAEKQLKLELKNYCDDKTETIPFRLVRRIYTLLKDAGRKDIYLHTLLDGSEIYLPTVKIPPRNPELEARIQKLKAQQANREYKEMTKNVNSSKEPGQYDLNVGQEVKALNRHLIAVINFLVTVGGAFAFGYKATEYAFGTNSMPMQMMSGLILATVVFFADLYFLVKYSPE